MTDVRTRCASLRASIGPKPASTTRVVAQTQAQAPAAPAAWLLSLVMLALLCLAAATSAQQGLLGEYFNGVALNGLADTRLDPVVDFTGWGAAPTGTAVIPDSNYSERWTGWVNVPTTGAWTFRTQSNDGVRLWVDDQLLIDHWDQHAAATDSATVTLGPGWKPIRLEHFQQGGSVVIQLLWSGPGVSLQIIPTERLAAGFSGNQSPSADAGPDQVVFLPETQVVLHGSGTDVDGTIAAYAWTQISGPNLSLSGTGSPNLTVSGLQLLHTYTFQLVVTDNLGATGTDMVTVMLLDDGFDGGTVSGDLRLWHKLSVDFIGPSTSETAATNPFRNRRLNVVFANLDTGALRLVPGFYAADGNAAESSATSGGIWRAHFTPHEPGLWLYQASFRAGTDVAIDLAPLAGTPTGFDGASGLFQVLPADPNAPGFLSEGLLQATGQHHFRFAGSDRPFLKGGADSPENLLAYNDFDQTTPSHGYAPHVGDWKAGDPQWKGTRGRELIGALNYLAGKGMNSVYFLTFNVAGDGDDVWPWTAKNERYRFDVSKLAQWEIVFEHMDRIGLLLHVVTQETENDNGNAGLDLGGLGVQRKLYYRELVARFGHHPALLWNLGEEISNSTEQIKSFHDYIEAIDPYDHPIVLHTFPWQDEGQYGPLLDLGLLDGPSMQLSSVGEAHEKTLFWRAESIAHGKPWVLSMDEFGPASEGVKPDAVDFAHDNVRKAGLWGHLMAGGAGVEWYFGYNFAHDDLDCEDWRSRDHMWDLTRIALDFFEQYLPFDRMQPADSLVTIGGAFCLALPGEVYAVYLPNGGSTQIQLGSDSGSFDVGWYDPQVGGPLRSGSVTQISGGGSKSLGNPPSGGDDWVALLRAPFEQNDAPSVVSLDISPDPFPGGETFVMQTYVADLQGSADVTEVCAHFFTATGDYLVSVPMQRKVGEPTMWELQLPVASPIGAATWLAVAQATDAGGKTGIKGLYFTTL